jgi:hypothetical protein
LAPYFVIFSRNLSLLRTGGANYFGATYCLVVFVEPGCPAWMVPPGCFQAGADDGGAVIGGRDVVMGGCEDVMGGREDVMGGWDGVTGGGDVAGGAPWDCANAMSITTGSRIHILIFIN